jgi:hypothetical protein
MTKEKNQLKSFYSITIATLLFISVVFMQSGHAHTMEPDLSVQVAALKLGMNGYIIGTRLSAEQKNNALKNLSEDAYRGTYKFQDGDIFVIATDENDTVLAIYERNDDADMDQAKRMISGLMGLYGEPTAMAHDKLIYWAYTKEGKLSEDNYRRFKQDNITVDVLATVKFNSSFEITAEKPENETSGVNYFIVSSEPLTKAFVEQHK